MAVQNFGRPHFFFYFVETTWQKFFYFDKKGQVWSLLAFKKVHPVVDPLTCIHLCVCTVTVSICYICTYLPLRSPPGWGGAGDGGALAPLLFAFTHSTLSLHDQVLKVSRRLWLRWHSGSQGSFTLPHKISSGKTPSTKWLPMFRSALHCHRCVNV